MISCDIISIRPTAIPILEHLAVQRPLRLLLGVLTTTAAAPFLFLLLCTNRLVRLLVYWQRCLIVCCKIYLLTHLRDLGSLGLEHCVELCIKSGQLMDGGLVFFMPSCKFVDGVIVLLDGFHFDGVRSECGVVDGGVFLEAYFCGPELFEMPSRFFIASTRMPLFILCDEEALAHENTHCDVDHLVVNDWMP